MITVHERRQFPDWWTLHPEQDPRMDGLLDLSGTLCEIFDLAMGDISEVEDDSLLPTPLEVARMLRSAAERIEFLTGDFGHGPGNTMT